MSRRPRGNLRDVTTMLGVGGEDRNALKHLADELVAVGAVDQAGAMVLAAAGKPVKKRSAPAPFTRRVPRSSRILALDLAAITTGWAFLDRGQVGDVGTFGLPKIPRHREDRAAFLLRRGDVMADVLELLVRTYRPMVLAYEYPNVARPFYSGGTKGREFLVARALGNAEAFLLSWARGRDLEVIAVPVTAVKLAVSKHVNVTKLKMREAVERALGLSKGALAHLTDDQIDAIAVGLAILADVG